MKRFTDVATALGQAVAKHPAFVEGTLSWSLVHENDWAIVHVLYRDTEDYDGGWFWEVWDCRGDEPEWVGEAGSKDACLDAIEGLLEDEARGKSWAPEDE